MLADYLTIRVKICPQSRVSSTELYRDYLRWMSSNRPNQEPLPQHTFTYRVQTITPKLGSDFKKARDANGQPARCHTNIKLHLLLDLPRHVTVLQAATMSGKHPQLIFSRFGAEVPLDDAVELAHNKHHVLNPVRAVLTALRPNPMMIPIMQEIILMVLSPAKEWDARVDQAKALCGPHKAVSQILDCLYQPR